MGRTRTGRTAGHRCAARCGRTSAATGRASNPNSPACRAIVAAAGGCVSVNEQTFEITPLALWNSLLDVKAEQQILVAQEKFPVSNDRVGPELVVLGADLRPLGRLEVAGLLPAFRRGWGDVHHTA